jgi:frataxin
MTDSAFESLADSLLDALEEGIGDDLDVERQGGVLTVEGEEGTWIVNKHAPTRQVWLSSPKSGARHYAFERASGLWRDTRGEGDLLSTLSAELGVALAWSVE